MGEIFSVLATRGMQCLTPFVTTRQGEGGGEDVRLARSGVVGMAGPPLWPLSPRLLYGVIKAETTTENNPINGPARNHTLLSSPIAILTVLLFLVINKQKCMELGFFFPSGSGRREIRDHQW